MPTEPIDTRALLESAVQIKRFYGRITDKRPAYLCGMEGTLVWDTVEFEEITFHAKDGRMFSLFSSQNREKTQAKWQQLAALLCDEEDEDEFDDEEDEDAFY